MWKIKTESEIEKMRESNRLLGMMLDELAAKIQPGMSARDLDDHAGRILESFGVKSNFKGYEGFPANICVSVNDRVVHGIPTKDMIFSDGDIVSVDAGLIYEGYHSDAARTFPVGEISPEVRRLIEVTERAFFEGIAKAVAGNRIRDISEAIGACADRNGIGIVRELTGHGIGTALHEKPFVPNYPKSIFTGKLKAGMTAAIEPIFTLGRPDIEYNEDEWTIQTQDGSWAAHYENTILITDGCPEILSMGERERERTAEYAKVVCESK
jgi:methionyl aminopeptidase